MNKYLFRHYVSAGARITPTTCSRKNTGARILQFVIALGLVLSLVTHVVAGTVDPLPSWNNTPARQAIIGFVSKVTKDGSPDFIPPDQRIATFDNDGTLWSEQPLYFQLIYAIDEVKRMAPRHPEWQNKEPFASVIKGDIDKVLAGGMHGLAELMAVTHAGMTTKQFSSRVRDWLASARHPRTKRPYNEMVYQPMLELLAYLRASGFKTYIVSGGGIDFLRVFSEKTYGIPPEQVVGSSIKAKYEVHNGVPVIVKIPELDFFNDKEGKPVGIHQYIGRRPVFAAGNSDGDFQMLEWTTAGSGARFGLIVHHTDLKREWAYDRDSHIGRLDKGLDQASKKGWIVVDMKKDWKVIYPFDKR